MLILIVLKIILQQACFQQIIYYKGLYMSIKYQN